MSSFEAQAVLSYLLVAAVILSALLYRSLCATSHRVRASPLVEPVGQAPASGPHSGGSARATASREDAGSAGLGSREERPRPAHAASGAVLVLLPTAASGKVVERFPAAFANGVASLLQCSGTNISIQVSAGELGWAYGKFGTSGELPGRHDQLLRHSSAPAANMGQLSTAGGKATVDSGIPGSQAAYLAPGNFTETIGEDNLDAYPAGRGYLAPQFQYFSSSTAAGIADFVAWASLESPDRTRVSFDFASQSAGSGPSETTAGSDALKPSYSNYEIAAVHPAAKGGGNGNGGNPPGQTTPPGLIVAVGKGGNPHSPRLPVPEPGAWSMILLGIIVLFAGRWSHSPPWR